MKLPAYITLSRPLNIVLSSVSVWITATFFEMWPPLWLILCAMGTVVLLNAGANAVNDAFDIEIDRINRPERILPSGQLTIRQAWRFAFLMFGAGNLLSLAAGWQPFVISALAATPLMILYSARLKGSPLWGNLLVSFILGLAFLYSALALGDIRKGIVPAILAFFYTLIRELIKDVEDLNGDIARAARTFPVVFGVKRTLFLLVVLILLLIAVLPLPWLAGIYGPYYLLVVVFGVALPLLLLVAYLLLRGEQAHFGRLSIFLKADIFMGLFSIYLGKF